MSTTLRGILISQTGELVDISFEGTCTWPKLNQIKNELVGQLSINEGNFSIEFNPEVRNEELGDIFSIATHIIDSVVLARCLAYNKGVHILFESIKIGDGSCMPLTISRQAQSLPFDEDRVRILTQNDPTLRAALRDFNYGLLFGQDAPLFFYRCIETLGQAVLKVNDLRGRWEDFHRKIGTRREDMKTIESLKHYRHGHRTGFNSEESKAMVGEARHFCIKAMEYLLK